jgi:ABC-type polysaccharide transport system permease subunit
MVAEMGSEFGHVWFASIGLEGFSVSVSVSIFVSVVGLIMLHNSNRDPIRFSIS